MGASNFAGFAIPKGAPDVMIVESRRQRNERELAEAYEIVNARDKDICRATGVPLSPRVSDSRHRREHHHLQGRNVRPEWVRDPKRIILVSRKAHKLLTSNVLEIEGDDADGLLVFHWNRKRVAAGSAPIRIRSKSRPPQ